LRSDTYRTSQSAATANLPGTVTKFYDWPTAAADQNQRLNSALDSVNEMHADRTRSNTGPSFLQNFFQDGHCSDAASSLRRLLQPSPAQRGNLSTMLVRDPRKKFARDSRSGDLLISTVVSTVFHLIS
jgi:hypothetical protein